MSILSSILKSLWRSAPPDGNAPLPDRDSTGPTGAADGRIIEERVFYRSCPLCDSPDMGDHTTGDCSRHPLYQQALSPTIRWKRCHRCNHIFTEGYYTDEACKVIFSRTHENQKLGYDFENQRRVSSRVIEKVLPFASAGIWLDVGFGNGSLLFTAKEYGFVPLGTDLRVQNVDEMSRLGIQAVCVTLDELKLSEKCDVISMADVLEHTAFPKQYLSAAHRLLVDNGILFLSMPNSESMVWQIFDGHGVNPYWGELEHYHNFSRSSLYALLREAGFEPVRYGISERYRACMEVIARKK